MDTRSAATDGRISGTDRLVRWAWYSVGLNLLLGIAHALVVAGSGSLAVSAELVHNAIDLLAALAVVVGIKLATRKSRSFPYGLYKLENVIAAGLAGLIFLTAYEIGRDALFASPEPVQVHWWMPPLLLITAVLPLLFSYGELRVGQATGSPALVADAKEYRVHVFTTGLALLALMAEWSGIAFDRGAALVIVVVVVKMGWDLLRDAMRVLLDASLGAETLSQIQELIHSDPAVTTVSWLTGRNAGRLRFVEAGVAIRPQRQGVVEDVVARIERAIREQVPRVERALIHVEREPSQRIRYALPLRDPSGKLSSHFGGAPFFGLVDVDRQARTLQEQRILSNPFAGEEKGKGLKVAEWLVANKVDVILARESVKGRGPWYVIRDAGVELSITGCEALAEAVAAHLKQTAAELGVP